MYKLIFVFISLWLYTIDKRIVVGLVVIAAYPNWHKAPERFGSALKEREREREKERTANSSNFVCFSHISWFFFLF